MGYSYFAWLVRVKVAPAHNIVQRLFARSGGGYIRNVRGRNGNFDVLDAMFMVAERTLNGAVHGV